MINAMVLLGLNMIGGGRHLRTDANDLSPVGYEEVQGMLARVLRQRT